VGMGEKKAVAVAQERHLQLLENGCCHPPECCTGFPSPAAACAAEWSCMIRDFQ
jgi:hypothetical protein